MAKFFKPARKGQATNWPLFALAGAAAVTVEALIFALLWQYEPDHTVGMLYSILTCSFSLLGLVASRAAGLLKADPRKQYADKAFAARAVSMLLILPTVFIGGGVAALKMEDRAAIEFADSAAYQQTLANSTDVNLDSQVRAQATAELAKAIRPTQVRMDDPAYFGAVLAFLAMMALPSLAVGSCITFAAETPAQEKRRLAAVRAAKAAATKAANAKAAAKGLKLVSNNGAWVSALRKQG